MSWLGVQLVTDAFDTIVKAMENEMLSDDELKEFRKICQNAVDICDKWIKRKKYEKSPRLDTIRIAEGLPILCGAALHVCNDAVTGRLSVIFADATHDQNAVAIENLRGPDVIWNMETGQVCNA